MKRYLSFLFAMLMIFTCSLSCADVATKGTISSKPVSIVIKTVDIATGKALANVTFDIWKETSIENGSTSECVCADVRTNEKGIAKVKLNQTDSKTKYEVHISGAPQGYADYCIAKTFTVKGSKTVVVSLRPVFTCRMKVVDRKGLPVSGAIVEVCENSSSTDKKGVAIVNNVSYGSNHVRVIVSENGHKYVAYEKKITLKSKSGKVLTKNIKLKPRSKWREFIVQVVSKKPIIYLYGKSSQDVTVKLGKPDNITCSYPQYDEEQGWNVLVHGDGSLTDKLTGRSLYSVYWEGWNDDRDISDVGFVVPGADTARFLEEKLAYLGLTDREAEEFIVYWLPQMQDNEYNYIRFDTQEEIDKSMPLLIEPSPDAIIRVWMNFTALKAPIVVDEQVLTQVDRNSYSGLDLYAVEWGGSEF